MVRPASFNKNGIKSGVWSKEEDDTLRKFVQKHGFRNWQKLPIFAGLARSGKSCRLRWVNYLQPGLKKDQFSKEEVDLIIKLHNQFGNRWSTIAEKLPGRTDNDVKNQWHAHIKKRGDRKVVTRAEMGQDQEQSFDDQDSSSAKKTNVEVYDDIFFGLCNNSTPSDSSDSGITYDDHTCFNLEYLPPFAEEEFSEVGVCYNHTPTLSDSSITYLSCLPPLILEEEFSTFGLCHNDTSTFPDLSNDFSQLPPLIPKEELFSTFGLCHNDTSTFPDLSDDFTQLPPLISEEELFSTFGLCYNDTSTFPDLSDGFSQLPPLIQEEEFFSTFGLYHNDTPTSFSDSLDGMIRQHNIDPLEEYSDLPCLQIHQTVESLNMNHLDVHWWL